jgi:hypothetical protein
MGFLSPAQIAETDPARAEAGPLNSEMNDRDSFYPETGAAGGEKIHIWGAIRAKLA